jgi:hypothetical protein
MNLKSQEAQTMNKQQKTRDQIRSARTFGDVAALGLTCGEIGPLDMTNADLSDEEPSVADLEEIAHDERL